jgi:hypothetical protein
MVGPGLLSLVIQHQALQLLSILTILTTASRAATASCTTTTCFTAPIVATDGAQIFLRHKIHQGASPGLHLHLRRTPRREPAAVRRSLLVKYRQRIGGLRLFQSRYEVDADRIDAPRIRSDVTICIPQFYTDNSNELLVEDGNDGRRPAASISAAVTTLAVTPYPSPLHHIHVVPVLSHDEAATCLSMATKYASNTKCWDRPDFQRHESYATCDFCVDDCDALRTYLGRIGFERRIVERIAAQYQVDGNDLDFLDLFCAHYVAKAAKETDPKTLVMDRLEPHRDGSVLSFTVLLSPPSDFEGGGTFFDALRDEPEGADSCLREGGVIRPSFAGDAVLHSGKLLHGADAVTRGSRTVLVGFVSADRWQRPGALAAACRDWGRMDVARWRRNRYALKCGPDGKGWRRSNANRAWLPKQQLGRSDVRSYCPNFSTVWRRADPEFQRLYKLRVEDMLLRRILLDAPLDLPGGADDGLPIFDDVTVL